MATDGFQPDTNGSAPAGNQSNAVHAQPMSVAEMEERMRVLAAQRTALLEGMREQLPPDFDPLAFDNQEERGLEPVSEKGPAQGGQRKMAAPLPVLSEEVPARSGAASSSMKFAPKARPCRLQGVEEITSLTPRTLRGPAPHTAQAKLASRRPAAKPAPAPRCAAAAETHVPKATVPRLSPRTAVPARTLQATPQRQRAALSAQVGPGLGLGARTTSPRLARGEDKAGTKQDRPAGRTASSSPSRSRGAAYGQVVPAKQVAAKDAKAGRQASSSPSRQRTALYGQEFDVVQSRRLGRQPGNGMPLWK
eukprot:TRINITY_DN27282_c0_g1_i1.p1 TRINITY_DN27282_c0_g1~~TRINITY_DN27282_c0_g1_i1.p1  ORF type:complete len:323 (-),score=51.85 TRINITY_DN27282_c0_g1_i1:34-954(-)